MVPMPHFGFVLPLERWQEMAERLKAANVGFVLEPSVRFEGEPAEGGRAATAATACEVV